MAASLVPDALPSRLDDLIRTVFDPRATITAHHTLNSADDYHVLLLTLEHPNMEIIVKLAGPTAVYAAAFGRTALLHQRIRAQTSVPVAEIVAVDETLQDWPWRYSVQSRLSGAEWWRVQPQLSPAAQANSFIQLGEAVAQLHTLTFPAFGEITPADTTPTFPDFADALQARAAQMIRSPRLLDVFLSALEPRRALFTEVQSPRLAHEDLHGGNLLLRVDGDRCTLSGILDFDKAWAGHHEIDLARLSLWRGMTSPEFWQAYRSVHPLDDAYAERALIYQLLWCLEYAVDTPQHLADTQAACVRLGLRPLQNFA